MVFKSKTQIEEEAEERVKAQAQESGEEESGDVRATGGPMKFACLPGFPKSLQLEPDSPMVDAGGRRYVKLGIVIMPKKVIGRKDVRFIDVPTLPCCSRADTRFEPAAVAKMLEESKYFQGDSPTLVAWDAWAAFDDARRARQVARDKEDAADKSAMYSKSGKRGAAL